MRVLHVITGLAAGGAEHQLRLLLRHLPAECEVVTLTNPGTVAEAIRAEGTRVHDLGMRGNRDLSAVPRLARLMRAGRYDLVHTHLYRACVYGRVAARLAGVPHVVATEHSLGEHLIEGRRRTRGVRALYLATERLGEVTVAVSDTVAHRLTAWGVPPTRIAVVPNGIDAGAFRYDPAARARARAALGIAPDAFVVGGVGRLEATKRFDVLLHAVSALEDVTLLLVGEGSRCAELEELARTLGMESRIVFTGEVTDVAPALCAMDVFASPSQEESFGLAVIEALAAGLPVLYVTCPALDDLLPDVAPGARRLPCDVDRFRDELSALPATRPERLPPPPAVEHYDIARLAGKVGRLYASLCPDVPSTVLSPRRAGFTIPHSHTKGRDV